MTKLGSTFDQNLVPGLAEIASSLGVAIERNNRGPTLPLCYQDDFELAHELGHWIVASPARKNARFFGLGDPFGTGFDGLLVPDSCGREEIRAHIMGAALLFRVGATVDYVRAYLKGHDTMNMSHPEQSSQRALKWLVQKGLISMDEKQRLLTVWLAKTARAFYGPSFRRGT